MTTHSKNPMPEHLNGLSAAPTAEQLQEFIANLPGMACQIERITGQSIAFRYVSKGSTALLNTPPYELETDSTRFIDLIHPEELLSFWHSLEQAAETLSFWSWEGRLVLPDHSIKWISLGLTPKIIQGHLACWEGMFFDITQSKLNELEIKRAQQQLQELSSHIQDAKEQERLRIAREIHDEIGSLLTAIKIDLAWLSQRLPTENPLFTEKIRTVEELVNRATTSASNLAHSLRPGFLDCFGIIAAVEIEAQQFSNRSGIPCTITSSQDSIDLPEAYSITMFRICQEALNNILKHAHAKLVQIEFVRGADHLELIISDDGIGFSEEERNKPRSFGLRGVYERVASLGGTIKIASSINKGTQIAVFVPLKEETPQQALFGDTTS